MEFSRKDFVKREKRCVTLPSCGNPAWRSSQKFTDADERESSFKKQFWTGINYVRNLVISLHDIMLNDGDITDNWQCDDAAMNKCA